MLRRKDRVQFPEERILSLLHQLKAKGKVSIQFASPQVANRFRFLLYGWRNLQRATDYQGLEPDLAAITERMMVTVDGPILTLHSDCWDWLDEALLDGKPLREWLRQEGKVKGN